MYEPKYKVLKRKGTTKFYWEIWIWVQGNPSRVNRALCHSRWSYIGIRATKRDAEVQAKAHIENIKR